jgi:single-stranded-DNA-specific exonuclease
VIGIVASRIVEKYFRPVVLIALEGLIGKGSGRSIPQFNLHRAFTDCSSHLVQFGGHAYAAGLTIKEENVDLFRDEIKKVGRQFLSEENLVPEIYIDKKLDILEINEELYKQITLVEPFGSENPSPIFLIQSVRISNLKKMGREQNHVRFKANQHDAKIDAIGFNLAEEFASIDLVLNKVDLVCEFQINDWNGGNKLELKILDLCCSVEKN